MNGHTSVEIGRVEALFHSVPRRPRETGGGHARLAVWVRNARLPQLMHIYVGYYQSYSNGAGELKPFSIHTIS